MWRIILLFWTVSLIRGAAIQQALKNGLCVCVADSDVYARDGPGEEHLVVGVLRQGDCFITHGGLLHIYGNTWYQVKEVNHEIAWINGYHLRAINTTDCLHVNPTSLPGTTSFIQGAGSGGDPFQSGLAMCTYGALAYLEGDKLTVNGKTCVCHQGNIDCNSPTNPVG